MKSNDDCAYAHYDTGLYTEAPKSLFQGERALAGRRLEHAQRHLGVHYLDGLRSVIPTVSQGLGIEQAPPVPVSDITDASNAIDFDGSTACHAASWAPSMPAPELELIVPRKIPLTLVKHPIGEVVDSDEVTQSDTTALFYNPRAKVNGIVEPPAPTEPDLISPEHTQDEKHSSDENNSKHA